MFRKLNKTGKVWLREFPCFPVTRKPNETRMGKGKGSVSFWASYVHKGKIIFEICGVLSREGKQALNSGGNKLPVKIKIVELV